VAGKLARAVVDNRIRLRSGVARAALTLRAEIVERCFALVLDRGDIRRTWLRGRERIRGRSLSHVAGDTIGRILRLPTDAGTPREFQARQPACLVALILPNGCRMLLIAVVGDQTAAITVSFEPDPPG
jgi:hypothetical protein